MKLFPPVDSLDGGMFLFTYENHIRDAIHKIKFAHNKDLAGLLSEDVENLFSDGRILKTLTKFISEAGVSCSCAEKEYKDKIIIQTAEQKRSDREGNSIWLWSGIPTDPVRLRERGFDLPAELFSERAQEFGGKWGQILCRTRRTLPMYGLSPEERRRNLQNCFAVTGNVRGKSVMLVDDIFTTGATFSAAASVLKEAGAVTVTGLAFCGSVENLR